jgi:hypothetical protein
MLATNLIDKKEFHNLLLKEFPILKNDIEDNSAKYLTHVEISYLRQLLEKAASENNVEEIKRIINFIDSLIKRKNKLHPEVLNAIEISFVEDLFLGDEKIYKVSKSYFTQNIKNIVSDFEK